MGNGLILGGGGGLVSSADLTAVSANVLAGLTYMGSDTNDDAGTGTMPNNTAATHAINCGGSYPIPIGYHDGNGKVSCNALSGQTSATATNANVLSGKTGVANGNRITGSMANRGALTVGIAALASTENTYTIPAGYHNGSGKVTVNSLASQTAGTAAAGQVLNSYTGWVNGSKVTGTMPNQGTKTYTIASGATLTIPAGYHTGNGSVSVKTLAEQTPGTAAANEIRSGYSGYVGGSKINGSITDVAGGTYTPGTSNQTLASSGHYLSSKIVVKGNSNLIPSNIKHGVNIFGVTGTYVKTPCDIYNAGTFSNITSGFVFGGGYGYADYRIVVEDADLKVSMGNREEVDGWVFGRTNAVTLTGNYTKINLVSALGEPSWGTGSKLIGIATGTSVSSLSGFRTYARQDANYNNNTLSLNISGITGTFYIYVGSHVYDANHETSATVTISRIYFSK